MRNGSALVTGASRGLEAEIARRLAADGWPVAVNYLPDRAGAERVVADIVAAGGTAAPSWPTSPTRAASPPST